MTEPLTLARLSAETGVSPRTIRSWVAEQLVPGPLARGRGATYPPEAIERVRQVRRMREANRSAEDIRRALVFGDDDFASALTVTQFATRRSRRRLGRPRVPGVIEDLSDIPIPVFHSGFASLAQQLGAGDAYDPSAAASSSDWVSFEVSPDVELRVRGPIMEDQRALIARCATAIGRILMHARAPQGADDSDYSPE